MEISVILPAYKEAENLKMLLPKMKEQLNCLGVEYEILAIDTIKAMDDTKEVCDKEKIRYINREGGNNYGDAIRTGIDKAAGKYIVYMDADGSHNPADILRMYKTITKHKSDVVIGSRYMKDGKTDNNFILVAMSYVLNLTYRLVFNLNVKDVSDSFRIYQGEKLKSIKLTCENFDIVEEILIRLKKKHPSIKIEEIPVVFNKRVYGESKRNLIKFIFTYIKTIIKLKRISSRD